MTETEFVALLDHLVARDKWLTETAVPMYQRAAHSIGRSVKDPAVRQAFTPWIAEATAVATRYADGEDITDAEVITLGVQAASVSRRLREAGATAEAKPEVITETQCGYSLSLASDGETKNETAALGSYDVLAQAKARVEAARAALAEAEAEAFAAEMALAEIEANTIPVQPIDQVEPEIVHTVPVQPEIVVNAGAQAPAQAETETAEVHEDVQVEAEIEADAPSTAQAAAPAKAKAEDSRPRIRSAVRVRHSVPKRRDTRPRIRRAETVMA